MDREHRISAGGIVLDHGLILLVRYRGADGRSYLVGPGGGILGDESILDAVVREVWEETGLKVVPGKILFVEDLLSDRHRITKIWLLCSPSGGQLAQTAGALEEGITEARWYRRDQLQHETVFPVGLSVIDWDSFSQDPWETKYLGLSIVEF